MRARVCPRSVAEPEARASLKADPLRVISPTKPVHPPAALAAVDAFGSINLNGQLEQHVSPTRLVAALLSDLGTSTQFSSPTFPVSAPSTAPTANSSVTPVKGLAPKKLLISPDDDIEQVKSSAAPAAVAVAAHSDSIEAFLRSVAAPDPSRPYLGLASPPAITSARATPSNMSTPTPLLINTSTTPPATIKADVKPKSASKPSAAAAAKALHASPPYARKFAYTEAAFPAHLIPAAHAAQLVPSSITPGGPSDGSVAPFFLTPMGVTPSSPLTPSMTAHRSTSTPTPGAAVIKATPSPARTVAGTPTADMPVSRGVTPVPASSRSVRSTIPLLKLGSSPAHSTATVDRELTARNGVPTPTGSPRHPPHVNLEVFPEQPLEVPALVLPPEVETPLLATLNSVFDALQEQQNLKIAAEAELHALQARPMLPMTIDDRQQLYDRAFAVASHARCWASIRSAWEALGGPVINTIADVPEMSPEEISSALALVKDVSDPMVQTVADRFGTLTVMERDALISQTESNTLGQKPAPFDAQNLPKTRMGRVNALVTAFQGEQLQTDLNELYLARVFQVCQMGAFVCGSEACVGRMRHACFQRPHYFVHIVLLFFRTPRL